MKKIYVLISCSLFVASLAGCKNTMNAVGDTAKGAGKGTVEIIQGVGKGVDHIGRGVKSDINDDGGQNNKEK